MSKDSWGRHWLATCWYHHEKSLHDELLKHGHLDLTGFFSEFHTMSVLTQGDYYCYSVEVADADDGKLHVHFYIELSRSIRWSTLRNKFQQFSPGTHLEARRGFRTTAMEYSSGFDKGILKPSCITSGDWGVWRPERAATKHDPADEIIDLIMNEAKTPHWIAKKYPKYFMTNGHKVIRLWESITCKQWLRSG